MRRAGRRLLIAVSLVVSGCFMALDSVRERAANEFGCPQDKVAVTEMGAVSYRVNACGHEATYVCQQEMSGAPIPCVRETGDNAQAKVQVLTPPPAPPKQQQTAPTPAAPSGL